MPQQNCACLGMNLDKFIQPIILSILSRKACTRYQTAKEMKRFAMFDNGAPDLAGIYRYMKAMEKRALIVPIRSGTGQTLYRATEKGKECLNSWITTLEAYESRISRLVQQLRSSSECKGDLDNANSECTES